MNFVTNNICIDWITMTTFEPDMMDKFEYLTKDLGVCRGNGGHEQYRGLDYEHGFWGSADQNGRKNDILIGRGWIGDMLAGEVKMEMCNISRVDIQLTLKKPKFYNMTTTARYIKANTKYNPDVIPIGGIGDGSTIYVGSAKSDKRIRLYEKGDNYEWLRFEVQLRRKKAKAFKNAVINRGLKIAKLEAISEAVYSIKQGNRSVDMFRMATGEYSKLKPIVVESDDTKKMKWIKDCMSGFEKFARSGERNKDYLIRCIDQLLENLDHERIR